MLMLHFHLYSKMDSDLKGEFLRINSQMNQMELYYFCSTLINRYVVGGLWLCPIYTNFAFLLLLLASQLVFLNPLEQGEQRKC